MGNNLFLGRWPGGAGVPLPGRRLRPREAQVLILLHDCLVGALTLCLAHVLRVGFDVGQPLGQFLLFGPVLFSFVTAMVFAAFRLHHAVWRHASTGEIVRIVEASTAAILVYLLIAFVFHRLDGIPRSVPLIHWLLLVVALGASRLGWRLAWEHRRRRGSRPQQPLIVVGSGLECTLLLRGIAAASTPYRPVAIIDPSGSHVGRRIQDVPVIGGIRDLPGVTAGRAEPGGPGATLVLAGDLTAATRALLREAEARGLETRRMPNIVRFRTALSEGRVELEPLPLQALIGRDPVRLDRAAINGFLAGARVVVTGAGGSIGSELVRLVAGAPQVQIILLEQCEYNLYAIEEELRHSGIATATPCLADIRDRRRMHHLFNELRPDIVFHAAALKHVPMVESNPVEGVLTNVIGTVNVADAARSIGVRAMVQISTDKAVSPTSVMGATKRVAEFYCQALDAAGRRAPVGGPVPSRFLTVRFGNVIGSSGSVLPLFQKQINDGGPVTVTHPDMRRYFMTIREAAELVLQASATAGLGG
jgi:O-antigen biosynthesis protein WbqV